MSSTTAIITNKAIAARHAALQKHVAALKALPRVHPVRAHHEEQAQRMSTEIAALRSSLHYYKSTEDLTADIERQHKLVDALIAHLKQSKGKEKQLAIRELAKQNQTLKEMLAASKLKQVNPNLKPPSIPERAPARTFVASAASSKAPEHVNMFDGAEFSTPAAMPSLEAIALAAEAEKAGPEYATPAVAEKHEEQGVAVRVPELEPLPFAYLSKDLSGTDADDVAAAKAMNPGGIGTFDSPYTVYLQAAGLVVLGGFLATLFIREGMMLRSDLTGKK